MSNTHFLLTNYNRGAPPPPVDTYPDARLIALFNGANGSTSFVDSSPYNVALTSLNGAALSTLNPLTGSSSLLLDDVGKCVSATIPSFVWGGTQQWCFEWTSKQNNINQDFVYFSVSGPGGASLYCEHYYGLFYIGDGVSSNNIVVPLSSLWIQANTKHKMAFSYDGVTYRFFVDGVLRASTVTKLGYSGGSLFIGAREGYPFNFDGQIDDFVVTMGSAKRTANYTPS